MNVHVHIIAMVPMLWSPCYGPLLKVQVMRDHETVRGGGGGGGLWSAAILVDRIQYCRQVKGYSHRLKRKRARYESLYYCIPGNFRDVKTRAINSFSQSYKSLI